MRLTLGLAGIFLVLAAACGGGGATGNESRDCRAALAVRAEAVQAVEREHAAALAARPGARAQLDAAIDGAVRQIGAAADLGPCEDGDPNTGVTADVADLRQRLALVVSRAVEQLRAPAPAATQDTGDSDGKSGHGGGGGGSGSGRSGRR
jgi:hypothetical protein